MNLNNLDTKTIEKLKSDYTNFNGYIFEDETLFNPLANIPKELEEEPHLYFTWLLSQPEYLSFICWEFLNIKPIIYQNVILKELWDRKFPMIVASRGAGKAISPDELIRIKNGWKKIKDINVGDTVYGGDGKLTKVLNKTEIQKDLNFYKIKFRDNREIECCEDHQWKVFDKSTRKYKVLKTKDLLIDYKIKRTGKKSNGFEFKYAIPISKTLLEEDYKEFLIHPYIVGVLLGDGCLRNDNISISSNDQEIIDRVNSLLPEGYYARKVPSSKYQFNIVRLNSNVPSFIKSCKKIGIYGYNSNNKFIPEEYKYGSKEQRLELLKGLMDTRGTAGRRNVSFYTVSNLLSQDVCDLLRSLGINCRHSIKKSYLNNKRFSDANIISIYTDREIFTLNRKLDKYLNWERSKKDLSKFEKSFIVDIEYVGKKDGVCIQVDNEDSTYITKDYIVTHNSFMLAVYAILRAALLPGRKIVVAGASFRQSKLIYEYCCQIWNNAPLLRNAVSNYPGFQGPKGGTDSVYMYLGDSKITFIPVGCLDPESLITTESGIKTIKDLKDNFNTVYGNGKYRKVGFFYDNGISPAIEVKTNSGYSYIGTPNHKMKVVRSQKIKWVRTDQLVIGDKILIDRTERWFDPTFECTKDEAYALGVLIADGSLSNKNTVGLATKDYELVEAVNKLIKKFNKNGELKWSGEKDVYHYWYHDQNFNKWLYNNYKIIVKRSFDKEIPENILCSSKECMASFISGLFDGDGTVNQNNYPVLYNTSKKLINQVQYVLLHFGIISTIYKKENKNKNWKDCYELHITGNSARIFAEKIGFGLKRKQNKINNFKTKISNCGRDYIPCKNLVLNIIKKYPIKGGKKYYDFTYKKILKKNNLTFSFIKNIIEYYDSINLKDDLLEDIKNLFNEDIFYDDIVSIEKLVDQKMYDINVPEDNLYCANGFYSHNSGETIRGLRANDIIVDEFKCVRGSTLVETNNGLEKIKDIVDNTKDVKLFNRYGELEKPSDFIRTPETDSYEVIVKNGYSFVCSSIHKVLTVDGWKLGKELKNNDYLIFDNKYVFPKSYIKQDDLILEESIAELLGLLVSKGSVTNKNSFSIYTTDQEMVDYITNKYQQFNPKVYIRKSYSITFHNTKLRDTLLKFGLEYKSVLEKEIPSAILKSPRNVVLAFLKGLFYGDGSVFKFYSSNKNRLGCSYYSDSLDLIDQLHVLLWKLGYLSNKQSIKSKISKNKQWLLRLNEQYAYDFIKEINVDKFNKIINKEDFFVQDRERHGNIYRKKDRFIASCYYNGQNIYVGSFNNEEEAQDKIYQFYKDNPFCLKVKSVKKLDKKEQLYDFTLPETNSFYGNGFVQHNSLNREIFENVIAGFAAVEGSPHEKVTKNMEKEFNNIIGIENIHRKDSLDISNQIIISGTAYYYFNHFAEYWERWHQIISSKGRKDKIAEIFPEGTPDGFDWKDYSIIRLPYDVLPKSYMDSGNIARSKATLHKGLFQMEFGAVFSKDSDGFFKASLVESCVTNPRNQIEKDGELITFLPRLSGDPNKKYYMGVDTASQVDNFAIVILEVHNNHRRVVYCWTTNTKEFRNARKSGDIEETDFFQYCSRKIRNLMLAFSIHRISIDSQGGGRTIYECLHDKNSLKENEQMLWEVIDPNKKNETDSEEGLHIIEMVNFRKQDYTSPANHNMRKDLEDKSLLFPEYNPAVLASFANLENKYFQEMEDCIESIEELKKELTQIVITGTATGSERFDTPDVKTSGSEKGRARKDRYSALIMANTSARTDHYDSNSYSKKSMGDIANISLNKTDTDFVGPSWLTERLNGMY